MKFMLIKKQVALILILAFIAPSVFLINPRPLHANGGAGALGCLAGGIAIGGGVAAAAAVISVPTFDLPTNIQQTALTTKECFLDSLAVLLREVIISSVVRSVVNWINSGFEGSPAFVTDLNGFVRDIIDETIGTFIAGSELSFLCSPFRLNIQIAIRSNFDSRRKPICTLTEIVDNIEDFYKGSFSGGWNSFITLTTTTSNNPFFAYIDASFKLEAEINSKLSEQLRVLDWGNGFLSFQVCGKVRGDTRNSGRSNCTIATPGKVVETQINNTLFQGQANLALADEIDEILGALLNQLLQKALTGAGGLLGLSGGSGGRRSYVDRLANQSERRAGQGFRDVSSQFATGPNGIEGEYKKQKEKSLAALVNSEDRLKAVIACYDKKLKDSAPLGPGNPQPPILDLSPSERSTAALRVSQASSTIATNITSLKIAIEADIAQSDFNVERLNEINEKIEAAETRGDVEEITENELNPLLESGVIHSQQDLNEAFQQTLDVDTLTDNLNNDTKEKSDECIAFPDRSGLIDGGL
ncbi:MAG: hypothetical protein QF679_02605 [Candidatus Pacebacteria bacterium]|nr:hypothetical protein [Candidatus Paceibacterota bacterium]